MDIDDQDSNTPLSCQEIDDFIGKLERGDEDDVEDEDDGDIDIIPSLWYTDSALDPALDPGPLIISSEESQKFAAVHQKSKDLKKSSKPKYPENLETHLMKMALFNGEYWLCLKCQFKHSNKAGVLKHVSNYHCQNLIRCQNSKCSFVTTTESELEIHSRVHQVRNPPQPGLYDFQQVESGLLEKAVFSGSDWSCAECDFGHTDRDNVLNHIEVFHPPPGFMGYKCNKCDLQQRCRFSLRSHIESHHKEKQPRYIKPKEEFQAKETVKNVVYVFRCKWCKKVFSERPKLRQHLKEDHGQNSYERRRFNCSFCSYHCYTIEDIKSHLTATHPGGSNSSQSLKPKQPRRNFICPICSLKFFDETSYKQHIETVEGFRFSCSLCGSVFKDEESLNFHTIYSDDCSTKQDMNPQSLSQSDLTLEETCTSLIDILQNVPANPEQPKIKRLKVGSQAFIVNNGGLTDRAQVAVRNGNIQVGSKVVLGVKNNQKEMVTLNRVPISEVPENIRKTIKVKEESGGLTKKLMTNTQSLLKPQALRIKEQEKDVFECNKCNERFAQKQELGKHLLTHLKPPVPDTRNPLTLKTEPEESGGELSCNMCQETFSQKSDLGKHLLSHLKEGIQCSFCPQVHHSLKDAREHRATHQSL